LTRKKTIKKPFNLYKTTCFLGKIAALILLVYVFFQYKPLIIIILFEILDIIKNIIKHHTPLTPIDLVFIFGIAGAYYYHFLIGLIIFVLGVVNRTIMLNIEIRHVSKGWRHILLFFIVTFMTSTPFFQVAFMMLVINYALKYILFIFQGIPFDKVVFHIINFTLATMSFYLIHMIYYYMPFLA
jgi:hypothetical protein